MPSPSIPESVEDDSAERRLEEILGHPSYRQADHDAEFLGIGAMRGVRLQIDYAKAELILEQQGVEHTIVVFGSTRIAERSEAEGRLAAARSAVQAMPDDEALQQRLRVAESLLAMSRYYDMAREFGRLVGASGNGPRDTRVMLMTGGGPGVMEGANRGVHDVDGKSIGLNIALPSVQSPNPYITPELCFSFHYFAIRKLHFLLRAKALVAFPGGYGTFDELFEILTLIQTRVARPVPVFLVGEAYWRRAFDIEFLVEQGVLDPGDRDIFRYAETAGEIWQGILSWHADMGEPLFPAERT